MLALTSARARARHAHPDRLDPTCPWYCVLAHRAGISVPQSMPEGPCVALPALSLRQPFASLVLYGVKQLEARNRPALKQLSGPLALHVSHREEPFHSPLVSTAIAILRRRYADDAISSLFTLPQTHAQGHGSIVGLVDVEATWPADLFNEIEQTQLTEQAVFPVRACARPPPPRQLAAGAAAAAGGGASGGRGGEGALFFRAAVVGGGPGRWGRAHRVQVTDVVCAFGWACRGSACGSRHAELSVRDSTCAVNCHLRWPSGPVFRGSPRAACPSRLGPHSRPLLRSTRR